MLAVMPRYEAYKDSGVEWLDKIPETWRVLRLKYLLDEVNQRSRTGEEELLSLSKIKGVIRKSDLEERAGGAESHIGYKKVACGQLVINKMQAVNGLLSISKIDGITSPDYSVYKEKGHVELSLPYLGYLLVQPEILSEFKKRVTGVMEGFIRLYTDDLFDIKVVLPPASEQKSIIAFLDCKTTQIDQAIQVKEKQITLLKERKQILIQNAVTRGLDPAVPMKDSGVDWIGEIPAHWLTSRSKWLFLQRREKAKKSDEQLTASQKYGVIPQQKFMALEGRKVTQVDLNPEILKHVSANDFVISMRSFQGGIEHCLYEGCVSSAYVPLIPQENIHAPYFKYLFKSQRYIEALQSTSNLVRDGQALRYENFCMVDLLIVPVEEQLKIAVYIEQKSTKINKAITLHQQQIERLKEYKATLINSAVTGKIKVA